jgi:predicted RNA-binding Zn ribbon-like protein
VSQPSSSSSWQPAGRAPAPSPLDLIQDFVNSEIPEWGVDELRSPAQLRGWLRRRGLLERGDSVDAQTFLLARGLRDVLRELALANTVGPPQAEARAHIDAALALVPLRLGVADDGSPGALPGSGGAEGALGQLLVIVLEAQRDGTWARMKACRQEGCRWLFYDTSRNRSGNWCSMSICGNRTKTRRYRTRRRGAA